MQVLVALAEADEEQRDRTEPTDLWPSDHAGVVATLRLR